MDYVGLVFGALGVILVSWLWNLLVYLTWRPYAITKRFREQGIRGPSYKFWSGSLEEMRSMRKASEGVVLDIHSHDITPRIHTHFTKWKSQYGGTFLYWLGPQPRICITDPEMVKQVLSNKFGFYTKPTMNPSLSALAGKGLVTSEGSDWAVRRRIINPAFTMDKLKMMTKTMTECVQSMIEGWQSQAFQDESQQNEVRVNREFQELTADVIARTAFGSSYKEGREVFLAQRGLQNLAEATLLNVHLPGFNYLPTSTNRQKWKLERKLNDKLLKIMQSRLDSKERGYGNDLLGLLMEAYTSDQSQKQEDKRMNMNEIIDECKTFFFAGHETTSHLLTWTTFLLGTNQEWQERLRGEVLRECGTKVPDADMLGKLKLVTMVLLETLRLYGPVSLLARKAEKDMKLGSLKIPKGTEISMPIALMHHDKEIWGADVNEFNPLRFENGIARASKHPNALFSFSIGPRVCIGQNFAMMEAKVVIAMILQRFSFSVSPKYVHAPANIITLQPKYGLPVIFSPLHV
ncbi:cytochrome P450 709B2-like isoform X2 [Typha angustifolia]|uniref:cytochrome P450 709B2-like isoform X2 n=1 Tax=Typha angustifolia TaxID=59011 RepID=UPI003C2C5229